MALIDLTGKRFGRLVVVKRDLHAEHKMACSNSMWLCQCDCGTMLTARSDHLRSGKTQSCGCLHKKDQTQRTGPRPHQLEEDTYLEAARKADRLQMGDPWADGRQPLDPNYCPVR